MIRILIILLSIGALSGCATNANNIGVQHFNQGQFDLAANQWNQAAASGDPYAQYNLGILWRDGLGSTPRNLNEAAAWFILSARQGYVPAMVEAARAQTKLGYNEAAHSWLVMAARWGNTDAVNELSNRNFSVPYPDLLEQQTLHDQIQARQNAEAAAALGRSIGCALGGGCGSESTGYTSSQRNTYSQTATYGSSKNFGRSSNNQSEVLVEKQCTSDFNCGIGFKCVKAQFQSQGVCMKAVNEFGDQQFNLPDNNSVMPNLDIEGQCRFSTDCPIGFRCDTKYKVCVK